MARSRNPFFGLDDVAIRGRRCPASVCSIMFYQMRNAMPKQWDRVRTRTGQQAILTLSDDGPGIPPGSRAPCSRFNALMRAVIWMRQGWAWASNRLPDIARHCWGRLHLDASAYGGLMVQLIRPYKEIKMIVDMNLPRLFWRKACLMRPMPSITIPSGASRL